MRTALVALAFVVATGVAEAKQPYEGAWAGSEEACSTPDDSNLRIAGAGYFEHEGNCRIKQSRKIDRGFRLDLVCSGEGEKWNEQVLLYPHGQVMEVGQNKSGRRVVKCDEQQRPPNWPRQ